jgi:hypothetical protein
MMEISRKIWQESDCSADAALRTALRLQKMSITSRHSLEEWFQVWKQWRSSPSVSMSKIVAKADMCGCKPSYLAQLICNPNQGA